jgi:hypothetical protein
MDDFTPGVCGEILSIFNRHGDVDDDDDVNEYVEESAESLAVRSNRTHRAASLSLHSALSME